MSSRTESDSPARLHVRRGGSGPPVLLVHGGLGPEVTWARQAELEREWSLIVPSRRGYAPSPPAAQQDFLVDAADLVSLIAEVPGGVHLVGYSYGGLGSCLAAERAPGLIRSLTLVEAPLWSAAAEDESVRRLMVLSDRFAAEPANAQAEREFYALAGLAPDMLSRADIRASMAMWRELRSPREAQPRFETIAEAEIPVLVASGEHNPGMERLCDAVAARLRGSRARLPGAGHAVPRTAAFNPTLTAFLTAAERSR
ncbi:alpha/beta fold hydrolase [Nocardia sp. NPDC048505]|uniref:alpha/beta fold hydrolase n=1 Tax=Nocardia sp. NPDC048505 TaxID=3155756 RepID=UPI00340ED79D